MKFAVLVLAGALAAGCAVMTIPASEPPAGPARRAAAQDEQHRDVDAASLEPVPVGSGVSLTGGEKPYRERVDPSGWTGRSPPIEAEENDAGTPKAAP
jgi:hypothetical protein